MFLPLGVHAETEHDDNIHENYDFAADTIGSIYEHSNNL